MEPKVMGDVLKDIRIKKGLSQAELAALLGYKDRTTVAKLESGENGLPAGRAAFVAERLGVTEAYLTNSLERTLYALDVCVEYKGSCVRVYDEDHGRELCYEPATWERLKSEDDFRAVWERLTESENTTQPIVEEPDLSPRAARVGFLYDRASERDRKLVDTVLDVYEEAPITDTAKLFTLASTTTAPKVKRRSDGFAEITVYEDQLPAAGPSSYFDAPRCHTEQYPAYLIPQGATFAVPIAGDSMEPKYKNGATVFVQSAPRVENGEVGLFSLNGAPYIKQLVVDDIRHEVRLHSLNPAYEDIPVGAFDDLRTFGRVLGSYSI